MKGLFIVVCFMVSSFAFAADETHGVSAGIGLGLTSSQLEKELENDDFVIHYDLAYRYQFNTSWAAEFGYMKIHDDPTSSLFDGLTDSFDFYDASSLRLASIYSYSLSERNKLLFKLGVTHYSVDYDLDKDDIQETTDGYGIIAGLGWRCRFHSGFELYSIYHYQTMDVIDSQTLTFGIGYSF